MNALAGTRSAPALSERPRVEGPRAQIGAFAAVAALAVGGYVVFSDVRLGAAVCGVAVLALLGVVGYHRPRTAVVLAMALLLGAVTKFRIREADASLDGRIDMQIAFELALFAAIGVGGLAALIRSRMATSWRAALRIAGEDARLGAVELLIAAYVFIAMLSALWSTAPTLSLVRGVQLGIVTVLAMAAVRVLGSSVTLWASTLACGIYTTCCATLALTVPWAIGIYEPRNERYRFSWFALHPIEAGTFAGIAAVGLVAAILWRPRELRRHPVLMFLCYPLAAASVIVLALTNSRGPLLAFAAALVIMTFFRLPARWRPALAAVCLAAGVVFAATGTDFITWVLRLNSSDSAVARFLLQGESADDLLAMNGRMDLWETVGPDLATHGAFGYGYHASRAVLLESASWTPAYAHNALFQSLLDLGIVGTLPLLAIVGVALSALFRSRLQPHVRAAAAGLAVFLVLNAVSTESFAGACPFDALLLLVCALAARE